MLDYESIKEVHLELSSNCNAACPLCPRNFYGMQHNSGYAVTELTLRDVQRILEPEFIRQLNTVLINGNLGDFMLARESLDIVEYLRHSNSKLKIEISTNGSAKSANFWNRLAALDAEVHFCIDGLADTHSLYRRNTQFEQVIFNAGTYIRAGGRAVWKMIRFDHNVHQIDEARAMSKELGFAEFSLIDHGRSQGPVFDKEGNYLYSIGGFEYQGNAKTFMLHLEKAEYSVPVKGNISCMSKNLQTIYISATGEVYPCCYLGFSPRTFQGYHGNEQIKKLLGDFNNNALEQPLKDCIQWFNRIEETWTKQSYSEGLLYRCNLHCGHS